MMITIHGLPVTIKYQDLKVLIKQECNVSDFILDYLVSDGEGCKKVRVGLADDSEGSQLIKCLDGYRLSGHVLRLIPVGKSVPTLSQPQTQTYPQRGNFPHNDYPTQVVKSIEPKPTPWSANQWTSNPVPTVNAYNYQQPQTINAPYIQSQTVPPVKQFDNRDIPTANRAQTNIPQNYNFASKSNLISLGPSRNVTSIPTHEVPETSNRIQATRYPNYEAPEKPIVIMKDNFQGAQSTQYINTQSASYQNQHTWSGQQIQKTYEKHSTMYDKKYDERKYLQTQTSTDVAKDTFKYDRSEYPKYSDERRNISPDRQIDRLSARNIDRPPERHIQPDRHIDLPPDRHINRPSDRDFDRSTDRHIRSSDRNIDRTSNRNIDRPSDRQLERPERNIDMPLNRDIDRQYGRNIDRPSDQHMERQSDRHIDRPSDRNIDRPSDRNIDRPSDRNIDRPSDRNIDRPSDRNIDRPSDRHINRPSDRRIEKQNNVTARISPSRQMLDRIGRRTPDISRMEDRFSPNKHRQQSPRRMVSPSMRKEEYVRGRRVSPPTHSPMERHSSRQSPSRVRHESPPRQARYSPRHTDKSRDYNESRVKDVRPAYETQASKAAMYSGGYRPNVQVDVQYPRKDWQDREKPFSPKNIPDDRRDIVRMQKFDIPRASEQQRLMEDEKKRSRSRTSRSPRRERSPVRLRRHSPSPRSPRRSWALEKRRSPEGREPPPPPAWPGQDGREQDYQKQRSKFPDRESSKKTQIWEDKKNDDYGKNDRRNFEEQRSRKEVPKWKPLPSASSGGTARFVDDNRYRKDDKYGRKDFEARSALSRDDGERKSYTERHDKDISRSERDGGRYKTDFSREEFAGRIEEKKKEILHKQEQLQKEIEEVYKRAVDFTKKAELYKKVEVNKDFHYKDEGRRENKEYEERHQYSFEDDRRGREDIRKEYPKSNSRADASKPSSFTKSRDSEDFERKFGANAAMKIKRIKATDEISEKILNRFAVDIPSDFKKRVNEELNLTIGKILLEMFGDKDVSFIEMLVKFNARHTQKDEERIFEDVMSCLPSHYRSIKRSAKDDSGIPAKIPRLCADSNIDKDEHFMNKQMKRQSEPETIKFKPMPEKKRPLEVFKNEEEVKAKVKITKAVKNEATVRKVVRKEGNSVKKEVKIVKPVKKVATKRELQTLIQKKNVKDESKVNQGTDLPVEGQFELNALMTQVLEEELENIMTQVWKTLPNLASTDVERFVTERLKNDAIVELKNVLGLNVTKRLLNVYNPLFVKIQFSGRPENGFLSKFLKNYNITSFKRIDRETNTFAAKLDTIADFDRICTANDLKCGSAQLNVTPCYKFKKCPNNLNTIYNSRTESENYLEDTDRSKNDKSDQEISKQEILTPDKAKPVEKSTQEIKTEQIKTANENKIVKGNKLDKKNSKLLKIKKTKNVMYEVNQTDPKLNEEMNDEEILALISGGVVLDECSGSDKE